MADKENTKVLNMNSATLLGLCVASTAVAITVSITAAVDPVEQDPSLAYLALALCMAFYGGVALVFRGVTRATNAGVA